MDQQELESGTDLADYINDSLLKPFTGSSSRFSPIIQSCVCGGINNEDDGDNLKSYYNRYRDSPYYKQKRY